jgi:hypothetical protein
MDISPTVAPKSDQLNADDFIGGPKTYKIKHVSANPDAPEQPVNVFFDGENLPFRPCKSMRRVMIATWGADASKYTGMSMTLYRDPSVKWGGMEVGGIRISHMSGIDKPITMALTASKSKRAPYTVKPLADEKPSSPAQDQSAIQTEAREYAEKGKDAFNEWWKLNPEKRDAAKLIMDELKTIVDAATQDDDEVPL